MRVRQDVRLHDDDHALSIAVATASFIEASRGIAKGGEAGCSLLVVELRDDCSATRGGRLARPPHLFGFSLSAVQHKEYGRRARTREAPLNGAPDYPRRPGTATPDRTGRPPLRIVALLDLVSPSRQCGSGHDDDGWLPLHLRLLERAPTSVLTQRPLPFRCSAEVRCTSDRLFDGRARLHQVVQHHDRMDFDVGVQCEEPGLRDRRDLRGVAQVQEHERRSLPVVVGEIRRFGLQVGEYGLNRCAQLAGLRCCVPRLDGDVDLEQNSHVAPPSSSRDSRSVVAMTLQLSAPCREPQPQTEPAEPPRRFSLLTRCSIDGPMLHDPIRRRRVYTTTETCQVDGAAPHPMRGGAS